MVNRKALGLISVIYNLGHPILFSKHHQVDNKKEGYI